MNRAASWLIFAIALRMTFCQDTRSISEESKPMPIPALPFYDWGACPGEYCSYDQWIARKQTVVYSTWKQSRRPIAQLSKGDTVAVVTGVVITFKPGIVQLNRDLPEEKLKRGDTLLTYTDRGEGFYAVWFRGRYYPSFSIGFAKWPDGSGCGGLNCAATYKDLGVKTWWAKVQLKSGQFGWVDMNAAELYSKYW